MNFDDHYQLGYVVKSHGLNGEITIFLDVEDPGYYRGLDLLFLLKGGQLIPHFLESFKVTGDKAMVKIEDYDSRDKADQLIGASVYLPLKYLPELEKDEYYLHQLLGFDIWQGKELLGKVEQFYDLGSQTLLSTTFKGKEIMIPTHQDILKEVDLSNARIEVILPDGLLDLDVIS